MQAGIETTRSAHGPRFALVALTVGNRPVICRTVMSPDRPRRTTLVAIWRLKDIGHQTHRFPRPPLASVVGAEPNLVDVHRDIALTLDAEIADGAARRDVTMYASVDAPQRHLRAGHPDGAIAAPRRLTGPRAADNSDRGPTGCPPQRPNSATMIRSISWLVTTWRAGAEIAEAYPARSIDLNRS